MHCVDFFFFYLQYKRENNKNGKIMLLTSLFIMWVINFQVNIWEERKVFGSRGRSLKDEMLGNDPLPSLVTNGKSSNPIKIVKKDANSLRIVSINFLILTYFFLF